MSAPARAGWPAAAPLRVKAMTSAPPWRYAAEWRMRGTQVARKAFSAARPGAWPVGQPAGTGAPAGAAPGGVVEEVVGVVSVVVAGGAPVAPVVAPVVVVPLVVVPLVVVPLVVPVVVPGTLVAVWGSPSAHASGAT